MMMLNKNAPVICAECSMSRLAGEYLYCLKMDKLCYSSKPKWCPYPLYDDEKPSERQLDMFDYLKGGKYGDSQD